MTDQSITPPASPPPPPPAPKPARKPEPSGLASIADTIEAIIIALILALTFRAFIVEAFVIPTGSMAPTLLGANFRVICPKCGEEYHENASLDTQYEPNKVRDARTGKLEGIVGVKRPRGELTDSTRIPASEERQCPNCGYTIRADELPGHPLHRNAFSEKGSYESFTFPWANNGDRILVLKYIYNFVEPQRWDVIVFKEPMRATDNFIKRLIGLPGEEIEIIQGDIFVRPPAKPGEARPPASIARKPDHVQRAVWQLVYDNDHYPTDEGQMRGNGTIWRNPWHGEGATAKAWTIREPVLHYAGGIGKTGELAFGYGDALASQAQKRYLLNRSGYNPKDLSGDSKPVGDLHLETVWTPADTPDASISMTLGQNDNRFKVTWDHQLEVFRWDPEARKFVSALVQREAPAIVAKHAYHVEMNNVDRQVQFIVDGRKVLELQTPWTADQARAEPEPTDLAEVRIEVGGDCTLGHLKLMRDLYYTQSPRDSEEAARANPPYSDHKYAGTGTTGHPVQLDADEFFALGDNSTASLDSRGWPIIDKSLADLPLYQTTHTSGELMQIPGYGRIPRRFLLGKAFFVYWPAGYRPLNGAVEDQWYGKLDIPLVPNAGEMRFIR